MSYPSEESVIVANRVPEFLRDEDEHKVLARHDEFPLPTQPLPVEWEALLALREEVARSIDEADGTITAHLEVVEERRRVRGRLVGRLGVVDGRIAARGRAAGQERESDRG